MMRSFRFELKENNRLAKLYQSIESAAKRRLIWSALLVVTVLILPLSTQASVSLTIQPATLLVTLLPGETTEKVITVKNDSADIMQLATSLQDYRALDQGKQLTFSPAGSMTDSLLALVDISPQHFDLAPQATQDITIRFQVPKVGSLARYKGALMVEAKQPSATGENLSVNAQVGSLLGLEVASSGPISLPERLISLGFSGGLAIIVIIGLVVIGFVSGITLIRRSRAVR